MNDNRKVTPNNQEVFKDEDLEWLERESSECRGLSSVALSTGTCDALIRRLKAAERFPQILAECRDLWTDYKQWIPKFVEAYEAWRRSAGR